MLFSCAPPNPDSDAPSESSEPKPLTAKPKTILHRVTLLADEQYSLLAQQLARAYMERFPRVEIRVETGPEDAMMARYVSDTLCVLIAGRSLNADEIDNLARRNLRTRSLHLAAEALAFVGGPTAPDSLLLSVLRQVLTQPVGSSKPVGNVQGVWVDHKGSGLLNYLLDSLLQGQEPAPQRVKSTRDPIEQLKQAVSTPGSLALSSTHWLYCHEDSLPPALLERMRYVRVAEDAASPAWEPLEALTHANYPMLRTVFIHHKEVQVGPGTAFVKYCLNPITGQKIVDKLRLSPVQGLYREFEFVEKDLLHQH
jgi:hypothetical protein